MAKKATKKTKKAEPKYQPGDTRKSKTGGTLRLSSTGKWFKSSNSKKAQQQRDLNARLNAPIASFDGPQGTLASRTTERDLAHEAAAATKVKYGAQDQALQGAYGSAVQQKTDTAGYFQDYRATLKDLMDKANIYNAGVQAAQAQLPGMVTGLAQQTQGQVGQQQAMRGPEMGAIGAGTTATNASNAAAISQGTAGALAANSQLVGNASQNFNNNLVNAVAPAQQTQALTAAQRKIDARQQDIIDQKGVEGAYNQEYRAGRRTDEAKTLLAQASLGVTASDKAADNAQARRNAAETKRAHKAGEKIDRARIRADRVKAKESASKAANKRVTSGPFAGMTQREIDNMSDAQATAKIKAADTKKDGKGKGDWVPAKQQNEKGALAARMRAFAHQLQVGHPPSQKGPDGKPVYPPGVKPGVKYTRTQAANILRQNPDMDEAVLSAVLDAAYVGHLSPYTVRKLIAAKYKPSQIASSLGVPTRKGMKKTAKKPSNPNLLKDVF